MRYLWGGANDGLGLTILTIADRQTYVFRLPFSLPAKLFNLHKFSIMWCFSRMMVDSHTKKCAGQGRVRSILRLIIRFNENYCFQTTHWGTVHTVKSIFDDAHLTHVFVRRIQFIPWFKNLMFETIE